jgi:hypothetical protein
LGLDLDWQSGLVVPRFSCDYCGDWIEEISRGRLGVRYPLMTEDTTGPHETTSGNRSRRVNVYEAARILGLSVDAIRKRVQSGTIEHEKEPAGRVWILLDASSIVRDEVHDTTGPEQDRILEAKDETIEDLRDRVRYLEEESRRKDHLLAAALERIHAIEPPETPGASESDEGEHFGTTTSPQETEESLEEAAERRAKRFWRRMFGLE